MAMAKYASTRDELLDRMEAEGWGNRSSGDAEAAGGSVALVTISDAEKAECVDAMSEALAELGVEMPVGNFIVRSEAGEVTVREYPSEPAATAAYLALAAA
jgi:hypothetical protein